jgi:hypothetical protein
VLVAGGFESSVPIRLRALGRVFVDANPAWLCLGGILLSSVIGWLIARRSSGGCSPASASAALRYAGTSLQILGLLSVARGLYDMRQLFPKRKEGWFRRLGQVFGRPKVVSVEASAGSTALVEGRPRLRSGAGPGATVEQRLEVLEGNVKQLEGEMDAEIKDVKEQVARVQGGLNRERDERRGADDKTANQIENVAIGGLHLEVVGLLWLVLGVLVTSIPDEAARLLYFIGCQGAPPPPPLDGI